MASQATTPTQAAIIPIMKAHNEYALKIKEDLQRNGLRAIIDQRNESLNKRIRENTVKKVPYLLVVGDKEVQNQTVAVRKYAQGDQGTCALDAFIKRVEEEVRLKKY